MIIDLHNHTELSHNASATLEDYVQRARELQVAVGITEHNRLHERGDVVDSVLVLSGIEILNDRGDYLVFGAPESCVGHRDIFALIDYVHRCGGVIIAAHPFAGHGVCQMLGERTARKIIARVDAVEVLNGRISEPDNERARELAVACGKPGVGGSDAHHPREMFRAATRFAREIRTIADLVREIGLGRCEPVRIEGHRAGCPQGGE